MFIDIDIFVCKFLKIYGHSDIINEKVNSHVLLDTILNVYDG